MAGPAGAGPAGGGFAVEPDALTAQAGRLAAAAERLRDAADGLGRLVPEGSAGVAAPELREALTRFAETWRGGHAALAERAAAAGSALGQAARCYTGADRAALRGAGG